MTGEKWMSLRILIVEDDRDAQANLRDILELEGHKTVSAFWARDVRNQERLDEFDVILLDRNLPDGNGDDLLPELRRAAPLTAVILITGHADLDAAVTALRHGAADFLPKPIEPDVLLFRLSQLQERHRTREELAEARRHLIQAERLAAIGQTVAAISHEARNELNGLGIGLELLSRLLNEHDAAQAAIVSLQQNKNRLQRLFEEVRNFAAPIQLELAECNIRDIWRKAWSSLEPHWKDRDISFEETILDDPLHLVADAFRLEQVFRNIFENSLAACADPVTIKIDCAWALHRNQSIEITVWDDGPGLTREQQQNVFEAFFTTKSSGTGLGMSIVKRIVEAHGGTIVAGQPAEGAEFVMSLPLAEGPPTEKQSLCSEVHHHLCSESETDRGEVALIASSRAGKESPCFQC